MVRCKPPDAARAGCHTKLGVLTASDVVAVVVVALWNAGGNRRLERRGVWWRCGRVGWRWCCTHG